jgi:DNA-binding transcriptional MerR regulator
MAAGKHFTIGQLARATEIPASTVRYYERIGLLLPDDRSEGNYRLYSQDSLRRLRFIRAAQSIGFTLDDVQTLIGAGTGAAPSCRRIQGLIEERLADIEKQLANLRHVQQLLKSSLARCRKTERSRCCHVVETLNTASLNTASLSTASLNTADAKTRTLSRRLQRRAQR